MSLARTKHVGVDEGPRNGSDGRDHRTKREDSVSEDKGNGTRVLRLVDDNGQNVHALVTEEEKGVLVEQGGGGRRWILQKRKKKKKTTKEPGNGSTNGRWVIEGGGRKWIDGEVKGRWIVEAGKRRWLPNKIPPSEGPQNEQNNCLSPDQVPPSEGPQNGHNDCLSLDKTNNTSAAPEGPPNTKNTKNDYLIPDKPENTSNNQSADGNINGRWVFDGEVKGRWVVEAGRRKWLPNRIPDSAVLQNGDNDYSNHEEAEHGISKLSETVTLDYDCKLNGWQCSTDLSENLPEDIQKDKKINLENLSSERPETPLVNPLILLENNEPLSSLIFGNSGDKTGDFIGGVVADDIRDPDFRFPPFRISYCLRYKQRGIKSHRHSVVEELVKKGKWIEVSGRRRWVDGEVQGRWVEEKGTRKWVEGDTTGRWIDIAGSRRWVEGGKKGRWVEERGKIRWIQNALESDRELDTMGSGDRDLKDLLTTSELTSYCFRYRHGSDVQNKSALEGLGSGDVHIKDLLTFADLTSCCLRYRHQLDDIENKNKGLSVKGKWITENGKQRWIDGKRKIKWMDEAGGRQWIEGEWNGRWVDDNSLILLLNNSLEEEVKSGTGVSQGTDHQSFCFRYRYGYGDLEGGYRSQLSTKELYNRSEFRVGIVEHEHGGVLPETEELYRNESRFNVQSSGFCFEYGHGGDSLSNERIVLERKELSRKEMIQDAQDSSTCFRYKHGANELVNLQNDERLWSGSFDSSGPISTEDGKTERLIQNGSAGRLVEGEISDEWRERGGERRWKDGEVLGRWIEEGGGRRWIGGETTGRWVEEGGGRKWVDGKMIGRWVEEGGGRRWIDGVTTGQSVEEGGGRKWIDGVTTGRSVEEWIDGVTTGRWLEEGRDRKSIDGVTTGRWVEESGGRKWGDGVTTERWEEEAGVQKWGDTVTTFRWVEDGGERKWVDGLTTGRWAEEGGRRKWIDGVTTGRWVEEAGVQKWIDGVVDGEKRDKWTEEQGCRKSVDEESIDQWTGQERDEGLTGKKNINKEPLIRSDGQSTGRRIVEGIRRWIEDKIMVKSDTEKVQSKPGIGVSSEQIPDEQQLESFCFRYSQGGQDVDSLDEPSATGSNGRWIESGGRRRWVAGGRRGRWVTDGDRRRIIGDETVNQIIAENCIKEESTDNYDVGIEDNTHGDIMAENPDKDIDKLSANEDQSDLKTGESDKVIDTACANADTQEDFETHGVCPEQDTNTDKETEKACDKLQPEPNETSISADQVSGEPCVNPGPNKEDVSNDPSDNPEIAHNVDVELDPGLKDTSNGRELDSDEPSLNPEPGSNGTDDSTELASDEPTVNSESVPCENDDGAERVTDVPNLILEPGPGEASDGTKPDSNHSMDNPELNETGVNTEQVSDDPTGKDEQELDETSANIITDDTGEINDQKPHNGSHQDGNEPVPDQLNTEDAELNTKETVAIPNQDNEDSKLCNEDTLDTDLADTCPIPETVYPEEVPGRVERPRNMMPNVLPRGQGPRGAMPNVLKTTPVCPTCDREFPYDHSTRQGLDDIRVMDVLPGLKMMINLTELEKYLQRHQTPSST